MPTITVSSGVFNPMRSLLHAVEDLFGDSELTSMTSTQILATTVTGVQAIATGVNFTRGADESVTGTFSSIQFNFPNGESLLWSNIGIDVDVISGLMNSERHGGAQDLLENLLLPLDWTITASDNHDIQDETTVTDDGFLVHMTGNDYVSLKGGNDVFFASAGKDKVFGGLGFDTIDGGTGNDKLYGQSGNDDLTGGNGRDYLRGGKGNDIMRGGNGKDKLEGGKGDDTIDGGSGHDKLLGGAGADTFIFSSEVSSGDFDRMFHYELDVDLLYIDATDTGTFQIVDNEGTITLHYDNNIIEFTGVTAAELQGEIGDTIFVY